MARTNKTETKTKIEAPHEPKFYLARRDTRWDVYPQRKPLEAVALDDYGFWALASFGWFLTPTSYVLQREITEAEALAFVSEEVSR